MADLGGLGALLRAKEWQRAAIVAAYVRLHDASGRPPVMRNTAHYSTYGFAALGIAGLRSERTVQLYVERWLAEVGSHPKPGATVELPEADWPPTRTGTDGHNSPEGVADTVARITGRAGGTDQLAEAVAAQPEVAKRVVERAVLADPQVALHAERTAAESIERRVMADEAAPHRPDMVSPDARPTGADLAAHQGRRLIVSALERLREAAAVLHPVDLQLADHDAEYLLFLLIKVEEAADLVRLGLETGQTDVDWDAVAATWAAGPEL